MTERFVLPASAYVDAAVYERERADVFGRDWLILAALPSIPDGHARALTVAGVPVVLRRDGSDVRGFVNVCRHRGGPLVWDGHTAPCPRFRCAYHGWQYDPDGVLVRTPHFRSSPGGAGDGDDLPDARLIPVATRVWRGLVFASFAPEPVDPQPLFDELGSALGDVDFAAFEVHLTASHDLACNWKTYVENYLEGYHIPFLHPSLSREVELKDYEVRPGDRVTLHVVPPGPDGVYDGVWAYVWPNTAINVYQGGLSLERVLPLGPDRMRIAYTYLFDPSVPAEVRARSVDMSTVVTEEDRRICEALQAAYASGRYTPGWASPRHEQGVLAFQRRALAVLGGGEPSVVPRPPAP